MIKGITAGKNIIVAGGTPSTTYINNYSNASMVGQVRYHQNNLEVYDGMNWQMLSGSYANIDLSSYANDALDWAHERMNEEREWQRLAKEHPAVKVALDNLENAKKQLKTTIILSKDEQPTS